MKLVKFLTLVLIVTFSGMSMAIDLTAPAATQPETDKPKSASEINTPILDSIASYRGFQLPPHNSQCYKPQIAALNSTIVMDWHCVQLEKHRALFSLIFLTSWALTVFTIIMSA